MKETHAGDVVICWHRTQGHYFNLFSRLLGNNRWIISMCWLTPSHERRLKYYFARLAASNNKFYPIVNLPESTEQFKAHYDLNDTSRFRFIPDVYEVDALFAEPMYKEDKYCFAGGVANRDWHLVIEIAKRLPETRFVCVASQGDFEREIEEVPANVEVHFDIPPEQYYDLLRGAYINLLPLRDAKVAGLTNIIKAAEMGVPCISTRTPATCMYYANDNMLLGRNIDEWVVIIEELVNGDFTGPSGYMVQTLAFQDYIKTYFSPSVAIATLRQIMDEIRECE